MTKKRALEAGKSLLIILLLLLGIHLTLLANDTSLTLFMTSLRSSAHTDEEQSGELRVTAAATPIRISVCNDSGRSSVLCDAAALETAYEQFGGLLGRALESAAYAEEAPAEALTAALSATSVWLQYPAEISLPVLALWLDGSSDAPFSASWFALSVSGNEVQLWFGQDSSDTCMRCSTYLPSDALLRETGSYRPDGTVFAFEDEAFSRLSPLTPVDRDGHYPIKAASVSSACSEALISSCASLVGLNPYGETRYTDSDGTVRFRDNGTTLTVSADALVTVTFGSKQPEAEEDTDAAHIEAARSYLASLSADAIGDAALLYTGQQNNADGSVTLYFDYYLGGLPVLLSSGHAAAFTFRGIKLYAASANLRCYSLEAQTESLLPARQAASIAAEGSSLSPAYRDSGYGALSAGYLS